MKVIPKIVLEGLYIDKQFTMKQISYILGLSVGKVYNDMKNHGINSRDMSNIMTGRKHTPEVCEIISKTHKGKVNSKETREKISKARLGQYKYKTEFGGHKKVRLDGYIYIYCPDHPSASKDGYVMEHRLVMEKHIGRAIRKDEVVHHKNHKRDDNELSNLQLMTFKEHSRLHMKERHEERRRLQLIK